MERHPFSPSGCPAQTEKKCVERSFFKSQAVQIKRFFLCPFSAAPGGAIFIESIVRRGTPFAYSSIVAALCTGRNA